VAKPGVKVTIAGDATELEKALTRGSSALSGFGSTALGVFGGNLLTKGFDLAVGGIQKLGTFALDGVEKLDAMGDAMGRLDGIAQGLGDVAAASDLSRWGVDRGEAAAAALAFAKMGNAIGLTGDELKSTTPRMQKLAAQLASLGDGDPAGQAELIARAMDGNAKAAKALGVELPKGVRGMEAFELIAAQLGPQLDAATSGTASLADVGDRWDATLANLQLELAGFLDQLAPIAMMLLDSLMPAFRQLVDVVGPMLTSAFSAVGAAMAGFAGEGGASAVVGILQKLAAIAAKVGAFLFEKVLPVVMELAGAIADALGPVVEALVGAFESWLPVLSTLWDLFAKYVVPVLRDLVIPLLGKLLKLAADLVGALGRGVAGALEKVGGLFRKLSDWAQPLIRALQKVADLAGNVAGKVGGFVGGITGGGRSAAGGARALSVTVNAGVGDPVAIGREVSRVLGAYSSRSGHMVA
jgi:hypothetical protein